MDGTALSDDSRPSTSTGLVEKPPRKRPKRSIGRDWLGSGVGLAVFLLGVGLLVLTFRMAYDMFAIPPRVALEMKAGQAIDVAQLGDSATAIVVRLIVLILMAITGSLVANRGVGLYAESRGLSPRRKS